MTWFSNFPQSCGGLRQWCDRSYRLRIRICFGFGVDDPPLVCSRNRTRLNNALMIKLRYLQMKQWTHSLVPREYYSQYISKVEHLRSTVVERTTSGTRATICGSCICFRLSRVVETATGNRLVCAMWLGNCRHGYTYSALRRHLPSKISTWASYNSWKREIVCQWERRGP